MQVFEISFLLLFASAIIRHLRPRYSPLTIALIALTGCGLIVIGAFVEGWRWQMLPAQLGFAWLVMASITGKQRRMLARWLGAIAFAFLGLASAFLAHQLPVLSLPAPAGRFGVGTFEYSITDESRIERYAPDRNRELYVEVWYPAEPALANEYPVQSLYHELYEGDRTVWSFLFSYWRLIATHSHVEAPMAVPTEAGFPVLLFNHGLDGFTSQNQLLMEHLASHGYVVLSIAHPYESIRVNLAGAGTVRAGTAAPFDIDNSTVYRDTDLLTRMLGLHDQNWNELTSFRRILLALSDAYGTAVDDRARRAIVIAALDADRPGVFSMSMGGAPAGEFCKIDRRCIAGSNIDGTQGGRNWNSPAAAPFR